MLLRFTQEHGFHSLTIIHQVFETVPSGHQSPITCAMLTHHGYSSGHQLLHQDDDDLATEVYLATANFKIHMMRSGI